MADDPVNTIKRLLNNFGAELTAQNNILKILISHILILQPETCDETLDQMKKETLAALQATPSNELNKPDEDQRVRRLAESHTEDFFQKVSATLAAMKNKPAFGRH